MTPSLLSSLLARPRWAAAFLALVLTGPAAQAQTATWQSLITVRSGFSEIKATTVDASGNVYLVGTFDGTILLGNTSLTSTQGREGFVAKCTATDFVWARQVGGAGADAATAIAVAGSSVYVGGTFAGSSITLGGTTLANAGAAGTTDVFVARYTDAGPSASLSWAQRAGGPDNDELSALAATATSVYAAGAFQGTALFGATSLTSTVSTSPDVFVAKLTDTGSAGAFTWAQSAGSSGADDAKGLATVGSSVYVTGSFSGTGSFGGNLAVSAGSKDIFVARLTDAGSTGRFDWVQRAGGSSDDYAAGLAANGSSVYIAGGFSSFAASFSGIILSNNGNADLFVAKLTDTGTQVPAFAWAQRAGGTGFDVAIGVGVSGANVYVTGQFNSPMASFSSAGVLTNSQSPSFDLFVTRLTDAGSSAGFAWAQRAGGIAQDFPYAMTVSGTRVHVVGAATSPAQFGFLPLPGPIGSQVSFLATLTDNVTTASSGPNQLAGLTLYPNPAQGRTTLRLPALPGTAPATLTLLDGLGRTVRTQALTASGSTDISLTGLTTGLYHLRVQAGQQHTTRTLLVE